MVEDPSSTISALLRQIPCGLFVLTAAHDGLRAGVLTRWVQPCSRRPPMVMVSIATGLAIEPVIRDSRGFAICQIPADDRLLRRRFAVPQDRSEDPFITLPHRDCPSGAPVPERAMSYLDCQLVRHVDLEADHRLYVGRVVHAGICRAGSTPAVEVNGESIGVLGDDD